MTSLCVIYTNKMFLCIIIYQININVIINSIKSLYIYIYITCDMFIYIGIKFASLLFNMHNTRSSTGPPPDGFAYIEPTLTALDNEHRDSKYILFVSIQKIFLKTNNNSYSHHYYF